MDAIAFYKSEGDYKEGLFVRNLKLKFLEEEVRIFFDIENIIDDNFFKSKEIEFITFDEDKEIRITLYNFDNSTNIASIDSTREIGDQLFKIIIRDEWKEGDSIFSRKEINEIIRKIGIFNER